MDASHPTYHVEHQLENGQKLIPLKEDIKINPDGSVTIIKIYHKVPSKYQKKNTKPSGRPKGSKNKPKDYLDENVDKIFTDADLVPVDEVFKCFQQ